MIITTPNRLQISVFNVENVTRLKESIVYLSHLSPFARTLKIKLLALKLNVSFMSRGITNNVRK